MTWIGLFRKHVFPANPCVCLGWTCLESDTGSPTGWRCVRCGGCGEAALGSWVSPPLPPLSSSPCATPSDATSPWEEA